MSGIVILVMVLAALFVWPGQYERREEAGVLTRTYRPLWLVLMLSPVPCVKSTPRSKATPAARVNGTADVA